MCFSQLDLTFGLRFCAASWGIEDGIYLVFRISNNMKKGAYNITENYETAIGGSLGKKGGLWLSKIGFQHSILLEIIRAWVF